MWPPARTRRSGSTGQSRATCGPDSAAASVWVHVCGVPAVSIARQHTGLRKRAAGSEHVGDGAVGLDREVHAAVDGRAVEYAGPARARVVRTPDAGARRRVEALARALRHHDLLHVVEVRRRGGGQLRPGLAAVGGLQDAGAADAIGVEKALAGARVQDVRVARVEDHRVDGDVDQQVRLRHPRWRPPSVVFQMPPATPAAHITSGVVG